MPQLWPWPKPPPCVGGGVVVPGSSSGGSWRTSVLGELGGKRMATSSASPENLNVFVTQAGQASTELGTKISQVKTEVDGYMSLPSDYKFVNGTAVIGDAVTFNNHNQDDEKFVSTIRTKFIQADTNTLPDASIEKALADAGVSLAPRAAITVNEPMF